MTPLLRREGKFWHPAPETAGPFPGQHGGSVCGALAAALEAAAIDGEAGRPMSLHAQLLRPTPLAPFEIKVELVRRGGRIAVFTAELWAAGKLCATARASFGQPLPMPGLARPNGPAPSPAEADAWAFRPPFVRGPWFGDACEFRRAADGLVWIRLRQPLVDLPGNLGSVASLADWSTGTSKPDGFERPLVGSFPNVDLTLHFARVPHLGPEGWLGLRGSPDWSEDGIGATFTELYDGAGGFGQACQAVALAPP